MKRFILTLIVALFALVPAAVQAGDYHSGTNLVCSDCHVAHYSQSHVYNPGDFPPVPLGTAGPYKHLLRNEDNELCLTCHDSKPWAPDVFGVNGGSAGNRLAGGLSAAAGSPRANDTGYDDIDGHTLWSTAAAPGGTFANATGLKCVDCHSQHGSLTQYRNLRTSTSATNTFFGKNLTYAVTTNDPTKDVFERAATSYKEQDVDYNEPTTTASAYGNWCAACHPTYHGAGGATNMGGASGGDAGLAFPWLRHPTADVNIGQNATYISSLTQYNSHTNLVKVMSPSNNWTAPVAAGVTPTCFSCHKSHGNKNGFGLIYMKGTGTVTEEGDGGVYKDLCRQCHIQGA
jgi:hypothetical protein